MINRNKFTAFVAALALTIVGHPAQAQDRFDFAPVKAINYGIETVAVKHSKYEIVRNLEEVFVTASDLRDLVIPKVEIFSIQIGLGDKRMIHVYDEESNTWKFVGTDIADVIADKKTLK